MLDGGREYQVGRVSRDMSAEMGYRKFHHEFDGLDQEVTDRQTDRHACDVQIRSLTITGIAQDIERCAGAGSCGY
jgi:hypothetical protein